MIFSSLTLSYHFSCCDWSGRLASKDRELRDVEKRHDEELRSARQQSDEQKQQQQQQHHSALNKVRHFY